MRPTLRTTLSATAVAGALVIAGCGDDGGGGDATPEPTPTTAEPGATTAPPTSAPPTTEPAGDAAEAPEVVEAWFAALADGDLDRAWALVHPSSQEAFGGRAAFDGSASALAEGYGAWAAVEDADWATVDLGDAASDVVVVTVQGTLQQEGTTTEAAATAVPVRTDGDDALVEPFHQLSGPLGIEFGDPEGAAVAPDHRFSVYGPAGATLQVFVDDEPLDAASRPADGDRQLVEGAPADPLEGDAVVVTAVLIGDDGAVQAEATGHPVEG